MKFRFDDRWSDGATIKSLKVATRCQFVAMAAHRTGLQSANMTMPFNCYFAQRIVGRSTPAAGQKNELQSRTLSCSCSSGIIAQVWRNTVAIQGQTARQDKISKSGVRQIDPVTMITLAQTALAIARLFGSESEAARLQSLEIEMLRALSAQLVQIANGVSQILTKLDTLETLIVDAPQKVVLEEYHAKVLGAQERFLQLAKSYSAMRNDQGIEAAQVAYERQISDEVIDPLHTIITDLTAYTRSAAIVPIVSIGLWIQIRASILANLTSNTIIPQLENYLQWFAAVLSVESKTALPKLLEAKKAELVNSTVALIIEKDELFCYSNFNKRIKLPEFQYIADYTIVDVHKSFEVVPLNEPLASCYIEYKQITKDLTTLTWVQLKEYKTSTTDGSEILDPDVPVDLFTQKAQQNPCTPDTLDFLSETGVRRRIGKVNTLTTQYLMLGTWQMAANAALDECKRYLALYRED